MQKAAKRRVSSERARFYETIQPHHLAALWEVLDDLVTREPVSLAVPTKWNYETVRVHLMQAGDLISAEEAERRVLILENPAMLGSSRITRSLYAGLQLVLPGEVARCHRHTQSALRFVLEGEGAFTAVDGERAYMKPFDLILTPNMTWHEHGNDTDVPVVWLDGLDIPIVQDFDASFAERLPARYPPTLPAGTTTRYDGRNIRPVESVATESAGRPHPLFQYPYSEWRRNLDFLQRSEACNPHFGAKMEFINPATGGSIMSTISAFAQFAPAGFRTRPVRSTDGAIYTVVEGNGKAQIGQTSFALLPRDIFVVPSWAPLSIAADRDLVLFCYSDRAAQERLGLWREHREA